MRIFRKKQPSQKQRKDHILKRIKTSMARTADYMYGRATQMDDKLWQWWTGGSGWVKAHIRSIPRLWKRVKVMPVSNPPGIHIHLKNLAQGKKSRKHPLQNKVRGLYRRFRPKKPTALAHASGQKKHLPSIPVVLWGMACLVLTAWLVMTKITPMARAIKWSAVAKVALVAVIVICLIWLAIMAHKSGRPTPQRYAKWTVNAALVILLLFLAERRVMRWMKSRPSKAEIAVTKVLGDTATFMVRKDQPITRLVPGGGTLDAWYDPQQVVGHTKWLGIRKARVYSLKEGVDSALVYVCGYKVSPSKADCARS